MCFFVERVFNDTASEKFTSELAYKFYLALIDAMGTAESVSGAKIGDLFERLEGFFVEFGYTQWKKWSRNQKFKAWASFILRLSAQIEQNAGSIGFCWTSELTLHTIQALLEQEPAGKT